MSRSLYINWRGNGFWVYDITSSVFLKFLIDAACECLASGTDLWLSDAIRGWRVSSAISDLSHYTDDDWSQSQIDTVIGLCRTAISAIRRGSDLTAEEIESWPILENQRITTRGHEIIPCEAVARLGEAFIELLNDQLPEPPPRHWWFFTLGENPDTIPMQADV